VRAIGIFALVAVAATASAQGTKTPATKTPATKTPAQGAGAAATKTQAPATKTLAVAPETPARVRVPVIMREVFDYSDGGRRDPFYSLLATPELRPTIADLRLVGVLYDHSGRRHVAVMREVGTNTQYRVTTGMTLGRLRVTSIVPRKVIFTIEEFGLNRQDSLVLRK
jgi:hypothetical protein